MSSVLVLSPSESSACLCHHCGLLKVFSEWSWHAFLLPLTKALYFAGFLSFFLPHFNRTRLTFAAKGTLFREAHLEMNSPPKKSHTLLNQKHLKELNITKQNESIEGTI